MYLREIHQQMVVDKDQGKKHFAVLLDPDKLRLSNMDKVLQSSIDAGVDYFFIGGSLVVSDMLDKSLIAIKEACNIPTILFPGNSYQLSYKADAILFLSLISGRNSELLIGNHVLAAPYLKFSPLEILPTGYMLIDGGVKTTVSYISNTQPIPSNKPDIAACTAMAGEMLGLRMMFLDAGSGALNPVEPEMITAVNNVISSPLIVGGGIRTPNTAKISAEAGADIIVVGNAIEKDASLIEDIAAAVHAASTPTHTF